MKLFIKILAATLVLTTLWGCVAGIPDAPSTGSTTVETSPNEEPLTEEEMLYQQLFDRNCKIELNLRMEETELAKLQLDYENYSSWGSKSPIYRMADLDVTVTTADGTATTYTIEQVGVRMKGNTSRTNFYNETDGIYNLIHLKISFQETFDDESDYGTDALTWTDADARKARKKRTFATLEKMDIRWNKCNDGSYIREYYAYEMFRENGVLAPRTNLASVDWAGQHCGVYTIYEPVDKVFLQRNLPQDQQGGDLYKLGWVSHGADFKNADSIGVEDETLGQFFVYDLKTNKKTSNHEALKNLISQLGSSDLTKERFAQLVDTEYFISFAAVSYLLGNPDDLRNNYNNCYLYFPPEGGCIFIPYDYDRCLGVTHEWDPTGNAVSTDDPFTLHMAAGGNQQNPIFLYSVCQGGWYTEEYADKLTRLSNSKWVTDAHFESIFDVMEAHYADLVTPSKDFHNSSDHLNAMSTDGSDGNLCFHDYFAAKLKVLEKALSPKDSPAEEDPLVDAVPYIRADFTNWDIRSDYIMYREDDGTFSFPVPGGKLKVYDQTSSHWFGSERISEDTTVSWSTDDHTNIVLPEGYYYLVHFDPKTVLITITRA